MTLQATWDAHSPQAPQKLSSAPYQQPSREVQRAMDSPSEKSSGLFQTCVDSP